MGEKCVVMIRKLTLIRFKYQVFFLLGELKFKKKLSISCPMSILIQIRCCSQKLLGIRLDHIRRTNKQTLTIT
jgi:hypothetical protein